MLRNFVWGALLLMDIGLSTASAAPLIVVGTDGSLSAQATFSIVSYGGQDALKVELVNTSTADVLVPAEVLTGMFFNIAGDPALTPISATLASGSGVFEDGLLVSGAMAGPDVSGEWAYLSGLTGAPEGKRQGISSSGLGLFPANSRFSSNDLAPPAEPDGLNYGIVSAGDHVTTGNGGVLGNPLIKNAVTFLLSGLPAGFSLQQITDVGFQYGTSLSEPHVPTPEPSTLAFLALGALSLLARRRPA